MASYSTKRTLKAVAIAAIPLGILLMVAFEGLTAWRFHSESVVQAQRTPDERSQIVQVVNPYDTPIDHAIDYAGDFIGRWILAAFWTAVLVLPALALARRFLVNGYLRHTLAALVVFVLSAVVFAASQYPTEFVSPNIVFLVGGAIGLIALVIMSFLLPPNTPPETTVADIPQES